MEKMEIGEVADRLMEERVRLDYNRAAFARLLGISTEGLRIIESGQSVFRVDVLMAAASAGADVQFIVTGIRSTNAKRVSDKLGFENQIIQGNVTGIGFASNVHFIQTTNHKTTVKAETKPGKEHITEDQKVILKGLVDKVVETEAALKKAPKSHRAVWAALNKHCHVTTYSLIRLEDFEKGRKYLHQWLGRLNSSASAPIKDGDNWRKRHYSYIKGNLKEPDDIAAYDAYMKKNFNATSLTQLSNDELEKVYRYVAGRRNKRR